MKSDFKIENKILVKYQGTAEYVIIPDGVTKIGGRAFEGCECVKQVEIPESVTVIYMTTFACCRNLKAVSFPKGLKELGPYCFYKCESLERVDLTSELRYIEENTFENCTSLESVVLPEGLIRIKKNAFRNCANLSDVNLPDSLAEIEKGAFMNCRKLRIRRESGFPLRVWEGAGCNSLVEAALSGNADSEKSGLYNASIVTIKNLRKHNNADRLQCTEINGRNVVVDLTCAIGQRMVFFPPDGQLDETFARENHLFYEADENGNPSGGYLDSKRRVIRPLNLRGEISEGLLLPIEVLAKYTDIEKLAEGYCFTALNGYEICRLYHSASYDIDEKTGRLEYCRQNITNKPDLRIPYGVRSIGDKLFCENKNIKHVFIPYTVEEIRSYAFSNSAVESVWLSEGLRRIGEYAFAGCKNLKSIIIPGSVESIARYAFYRCDGLEELIITDGVKYIGENAFEKCRQIKSIDVPDSVRQIGIGAFIDCTNAERIRIPEDVKVVGETFGSTVLESLTIESYFLEHMFADDIVFNKDMTELIRYPKTKTDARYTVPGCVRRINKGAFADNQYLTEVIISNGVTHIGHRAFENCKNLRSVTIPPSVIDMGNFVFIGIHTSPNRHQVKIRGNIGKASIRSIMEAANTYAVVEGILIRGKKGSAAERYAEEAGCLFECI